MSARSSALRRVLVAGAVVALSTVFIAPMAGSSENSSSLDPPGVDVPGRQAEKVSGEATGCHSEIELDLFNVVDNDPQSVGVAAKASAAVSDLPKEFGQLGYLGDLLNEVQATLDGPDVSAAADANEVFHAEAGPVPTVKLPWQGGGPVKDSENDCTLDLFGFPIQLASDLNVESQGAIGPAGYAHTESESDNNIGLIYETGKISTECLATLADIEAKTDIADGQYLDVVNQGGGNVAFNVKDIPEHPKKNDELVDFSDSFDTSENGESGEFINFEFSLTANEQQEGDKAVTVTGLHSELKIEIFDDNQLEARLTVDGIRDQSHCDIHPIGTATPAEVVVVEPKFTG